MIRYLTSSRISSANRSILKILPTRGPKLLCHPISCFLSNCKPSSISMAVILAALKHVEVMDCIPDTLRYSSTPCKDNSDPYSSAMSLKFLWHYKMVIIIRFQKENILFKLENTTNKIQAELGTKAHVLKSTSNWDTLIHGNWC